MLPFWYIIRKKPTRRGTFELRLMMNLGLNAYTKELPAAASTVGYIPSRVDLFSIPFFFDYTYTARSIYNMKQKATDERKHDTKHHLSCWARRRSPPTHWRRLFLKKSLRRGFSFFLEGELSGCECWWLQSVKGPVNRAGVSIHRPMQYVYTVKELSSIYKELRVWAAADQNTISWLKSNTICWFDGT
jgi:hypothetical protein